MITMDLKDKKLELIRLISNLENDKLINGISDYLKGNLEDFWYELSDRERNEIKTGLEQLNEGQGIDLEDYLKKVS
ncbi:MAG: hypothetical protein GY751_05985 [Bacteroidetes bacterium]|nr:hypothetical protein [Bacteroidota bacterium]